MKINSMTLVRSKKKGPRAKRSGAVWALRGTRALAESAYRVSRYAMAKPRTSLHRLIDQSKRLRDEETVLVTGDIAAVEIGSWGWRAR